MWRGPEPHEQGGLAYLDEEHSIMRKSVLVLTAVAALGFFPLHAQETRSSELDSLRATVKELREQQSRLEAKIDRLLKGLAEKPNAHHETGSDEIEEAHRAMEEALGRLEQESPNRPPLPGGEGNTHFHITIRKNENGKITEREIDADSLQELMEKGGDLLGGLGMDLRSLAPGEMNGEFMKKFFGNGGFGGAFPFGAPGAKGFRFPGGRGFWFGAPGSGHPLFPGRPGSRGEGEDQMREFFEGLHAPRGRHAESPKRLGVMIRQADDEGSEGLSVVSVLDGSLASDLGMAKGDVIKEVNGQKIHDVSDVAKALADGSRTVRVVVERPGQGRLELKSSAPKGARSRRSRRRKI